MRYFVTLPSGREVPVDVLIHPTGRTEVSLEGRVIDVDCAQHADTVSMRIDGRVLDLWVEGAPPEIGVVARGQRFYVKVESDRMRALSAAMGGRGGAGEGLVKSPMPGRVLKVLVAEGDEVEVGTPLIVVEAMKMENELCATRAGAVSRVFVVPGATVEGGAKLVEVS